MQSFDIIRESKINDSFRNASICGSFDIQKNKIEERFKGEFNLPDDWNIGVIVGNSGTGKTTIAKELFNDYLIDNFSFDSNSVLDNIPEKCSIKEIQNVFCSVGFSSPPSWLKPYSVLSNGEKMRVDLARAILENKEIILFDEYTSFVDRNIAKIGSIALNKAIRKSNKKFIAISCHDDILEWLEPDWIFDTNEMKFKLTRGLLRRPKIEINIYKSDRKFWNSFKKYHYMSQDHSNAASCFIATVNNKLVGFISILYFPHPSAKNIYRVHRFVILPEYQGVGIGSVLINEVGKYYLSLGKRFRITTSQPNLVHMFKKTKKWILCHKGRNAAHSGSITGMRDGSSNKLTTSWELKNE